MKRFQTSLNLQVGLFTCVRFVVNISYRMVYPLLPVFSAGLGVDLTALSLALTARSAISGFGFIVSPIADRYGRRLSMLLGMGLVIVGVGVVIPWPSFTTFLVALVLPNLGIQILIPAMQAYLADRVPYSQLGRAIGITELSWAVSSIIGLPVVAWMIKRNGWAAPFPILAGMGILVVILMLIIVPSDHPTGTWNTRIWSTFGKVLSYRVALIAMAAMLFGSVANEAINFIYGVWIKDRFGLDVTALGTVAMVIGFCELGGSGGSAWLSDRLGKGRAVAIGLAVNCLAMLVLPIIGVNIVGTTIGLSLFFISYEFLIVSSLSLMGGVMPTARATMMAMVMSSIAAGRAIGDLLSPWAYQYGIWGDVVAAVLLNLVTLVLLRYVKPAESEVEQVEVAVEQ